MSTTRVQAPPWFMSLLLGSGGVRRSSHVG